MILVELYKNEIIKADSNCCLIIPQFYYEYFLTKLQVFNKLVICKNLSEIFTNNNYQVNDDILV